MAVGAALFGNTSGRSQNKNLVECKAGKMTLKGKMVHPDKRKGLLYVYQSDDSLMHFCWKDRTTGTVEDDLIIFPDDCEFKRVTRCTTGRVYVLKFKSSNRKFFFWVQEPKTDKDEENCRRINEVLNNPPTPGSARSGGATPDGGDLQNLLNNMSQQQLMQLFGGVGQIGGLSSLLGTMSRPSTSQSTRSVSSAGSGTSSTTSTSAAAGTTVTTSTATAGTTSANTSATAAPAAAAAAAAAPAAAAAAAAAAPATTTTTTATPVTESKTTASTEAKPTSGGSSSSATTAATSSPSTNRQPAPIQLSDLQNFLSGLAVPPTSSQQSSGVDLAQAITSDSLSSFLVEPDLAEALQQHLPAVASVGGAAADQTPSDQLRSTLSSPQFQQALSMFSAALQSGQLGPVVQQLEVGPEAVDAANQGNMEEFVHALQRASIAAMPDAQSTKKNDEGSEEKRPKRDGDKKPDDDDDEGMSMD